MPQPIKVVTVIQSRTESQRLPNKVMKPLFGKPLLAQMVQRVQWAKLAGTIVVATTDTPPDDVIETLCWAEGFNCFRGHPNDLLDRHYRAGLEYGADVVVKIPSDCPLIDPAVIDRVISTYLEAPDAYDYVSNLHPPTYPDGNDVEVIRFSALEAAWWAASRNFEREHTTPFLWENPQRFRLHNVTWGTGQNFSMTHRWTIDYEADYQFINAVYSDLYPMNPQFGLDDILALLAERPQLTAVNAKFAGVNWYRHHLDKLKTITPDQTRLLGTA